MLSTLDQDNFGSDLFRNGTLDDSDFDLFYDIEEIGKLLFDQFTESPDILFYRLPVVGDGVANGEMGTNGNGGTNTNSSSTSTNTNSDATSTNIDSKSSSLSATSSL